MEERFYKNVLFWVPYPPDSAPSQRFRFEQYLKLLDGQGIKYTLQHYYNEASWKMLPQKGKFFQKIWAVVSGDFKRYAALLGLGKYDAIFVHREMRPIGIGVLEFLIFKVFKKPVIFDFDDAVWMANSSHHNRFIRHFKTHRLTPYILKNSKKISAGNNWLAAYARQFNSTITVLPTTIDTKKYNTTQELSEKTKLTLGWTGSHSTLHYLYAITEILDALRSDFDFDFVVVADKKPTWDFDHTFINWNSHQEVTQLQSIDIGLMPLPDTPWANGKCGLKALQYMALGIVPVVAAVGVNTEIVQNNQNGFLCKNDTDWHDSLATLLQNREQLALLGASAKKVVERSYSVVATEADFLHLFSKK